ncbi:MAG: lactonase family protein [Alphaproteobacteria bacterium]|nr:lactonase family protein [Alphaproteobacteria bacterium]
MPKTIAYVANADSNDIHVLELDAASGRLTPVERAPIPAIAKPGSSIPLAVRPDRRVLYAGLRGEPLVAAAFAIDPGTGKLRHLGNGLLADSMAYVVTDRSGRWLLSASYGGNKVAVNPIGADGVVQPPAQIVPTPPNAHSILPDPSNRFVFAACLGGDAVMMFRFDAATGMLSPNLPDRAGVKPKAGPRHLRFHPDGKRLYLVNELDGSVIVFDYDANKGTLRAKQTTTAVPLGYKGKVWAADIHVTPNGKFLYASERGTSTIAGFAIEPVQGTLRPVGNFPTEAQPRGFAIDPTGRWLLAVGQQSHHLTCHAIDPANGKLTDAGRYKVGTNPNWVEIVTLD